MSDIEIEGTVLREHSPEGVLTVRELISVLSMLNLDAEVELDVVAVDHRHYSISDVVSIDNKLVLLYSGHLTSVMDFE
jgi:hypothetical protein